MVTTDRWQKMTRVKVDAHLFDRLGKYCDGFLVHAVDAEGKASGITGQATILVAGHHGSYSSSSRRFLAVVKPRYGIISCAKDNDFGHPHDSVLENFKDVNARTYRTDELGTIVIGTDGKTLVN